VRKDFDVKTACMHGNPLKPWKNLRIFEGQDLGRYKLLGEAYLSIDFSNVAYFTDTGRRWDRRYSVKDHSPGDLACGAPVKGTGELIGAIKRKRYERLYLVVHPNRWNDLGYRWLAELCGQSAKNVGKAMLKNREA